MQDDLTRLVGLEGFVVKRVVEVGEQLDLEVELFARAALCPCYALQGGPEERSTDARVPPG